MAQHNSDFVDIYLGFGKDISALVPGDKHVQIFLEKARRINEGKLAKRFLGLFPDPNMLLNMDERMFAQEFNIIPGFNLAEIWEGLDPVIQLQIWEKLQLLFVLADGILCGDENKEFINLMMASLEQIGERLNNQNGEEILEGSLSELTNEVRQLAEQQAENGQQDPMALLATLSKYQDKLKPEDMGPDKLEAMFKGMAGDNLEEGQADAINEAFSKMKEGAAPGEIFKPLFAQLKASGDELPFDPDEMLDGDFDPMVMLGKMMGDDNPMMGLLNGLQGGADGPDPITMLGPMMGMLGGSDGSNAPDPMAMLGPMMGMLGAGGADAPCDMTAMLGSLMGGMGGPPANQN